MVRNDPQRAIAELNRLEREFTAAFRAGLTARGFRRDPVRPAYLLYGE
jgi:hypothetical protein